MHATDLNSVTAKLFLGTTRIFATERIFLKLLNLLKFTATTNLLLRQLPPIS